MLLQPTAVTSASSNLRFATAALCPTCIEDGAAGPDGLQQDSRLLAPQEQLRISLPTRFTSQASYPRQISDREGSAVRSPVPRDVASRGAIAIRRPRVNDGSVNVVIAERDQVPTSTLLVPSHRDAPAQLRDLPCAGEGDPERDLDGPDAASDPGLTPTADGPVEGGVFRNLCPGQRLERGAMCTRFALTVKMSSAPASLMVLAVTVVSVALVYDEHS